MSAIRRAARHGAIQLTGLMLALYLAALWGSR